MLVGVFAVLIATSVASAALISHFGQVQANVGAKQLFILDGTAGDHTVTHTFDLTGGYCESVEHTIDNQGNDAEEINFETSINSYGKGSEGVYVYYREGEFQVLPHSDQNQENKDAGNIPYIEWEINGNEIEFTFENPFTWDYYFDYRVDGESGNDWAETYNTITQGECAGQLWGQYYNIVKVDAGSQETVTVTGCEEIQVGLRMGPEQNHYIDWIVFELPELDNPLTIQPGEQVDFLIQYCLDRYIQQGTYTVTTRLV